MEITEIEAKREEAVAVAALEADSQVIPPSQTQQLLPMYQKVEIRLFGMLERCFLDTHIVLPYRRIQDVQYDMVLQRPYLEPSGPVLIATRTSILLNVGPETRQILIVIRNTRSIWFVQQKAVSPLFGRRTARLIAIVVPDSGLHVRSRPLPGVGLGTDGKWHRTLLCRRR